VLFEEYLAEQAAAGRLSGVRFADQNGRQALLHGHCHQKAFGAMGAVEAALKLVPGLAVSTINSSCCGMAGHFGYTVGHEAVSQAMAERDLLPAIRAARPGTLIVADGTSCRHQIAPVAEARHVARVLADALSR
jgi:Fe-S oxidoreductase